MQELLGGGVEAADSAGRPLNTRGGRAPAPGSHRGGASPALHLTLDSLRFRRSCMAASPAFSSRGHSMMGIAGIAAAEQVSDKGAAVTAIQLVTAAIGAVRAIISRLATGLPLVIVAIGARRCCVP